MSAKKRKEVLLESEYPHTLVCTLVGSGKANDTRYATTVSYWAAEQTTSFKRALPSVTHETIVTHNHHRQTQYIRETSRTTTTRASCGDKSYL